MTGYVYTQALEAATKYFNGSELSAKVFVDKYALRDNDDNFLELTPNDMHDRLAAEFARIDAEKYSLNYDERFNVYRSSMDKFARICPQGSPMAAIGNKYQTMSASNCVVIESPQDSMGGILESGKELAQLYKRRCVEANSFVISKEKGVIPIKELIAGMHVLSYDIEKDEDTYKKVLDIFDSEVDIQDRIKISYSNGTILHTSKKHPVLTMRDNEFVYNLAGELKSGDINLKPSQAASLSIIYDEIGWFIGAHMGDGSIDKNRDRMRISGDNEEVIARYCDIHNRLTKNNSNYHKSYRKDYQTQCWEFGSSVKGNSSIINDLFDGQRGNKTYTGIIPNIVKEQQLWWSFLAGLIDTDGTIKSDGQQIVISICAKHIIDELACFLQSVGVSIHIGHRISKRNNEQPIYQLCIHYNRQLWNELGSILAHEEKKNALLSNEPKLFSHRKPISDIEYNTIYSTYEQIKQTGNMDFSRPDHRLLSANLYYLKTAKIKGIGKAFAQQLQKFNILSTKQISNILDRVIIKSVEQDTNSNTYIDIEVEDTNNFYCGNFGFVVIHNCGVGIDLSTLRPEGMTVNNAARTTTGAWSFADFFSYITRMVGQNSRRGALMLTLDVHHPDVVKFATMKQNLTKVTGANISVKLSDKFLKAVEDDAEYEQRWPIEGDAKMVRMIKAKEVWKIIIESATETAEPGLIMWDTMLNNLPAQCYEEFKHTSTNPCAELPLSAYDSCRLISINLTGYIKNAFSKEAVFDFKLFTADIATAQQMADNLVDLELELIDRIKNKCGSEDEKILWKKLWNAASKGRRTGVGTHGLADTLAQLCIKYDSDQALETIDKIYKTLRDVAYDTSAELARVRGAFPVYNYEQEQNCAFIKRLPKAIKEKMQKYGRRNISLLTQAPTGSVSIESKVGAFDRFNVSSGVEPVFRNSYTRRKKINPDDKNVRVDFTDIVGDKWQEFAVFHSNVQNYFEHKGMTPDASKLPSYFITSDKINWNRRVEIQGVEQQYIDHSISSTINLPRGTSAETVGTIYLESWKKGLKGVTVYVDGSRDGVLIEKSKQIASKDRPEAIQPSQAPKRPAELICDIKKAKVQGEEWTIFVGLLNDKPYEIFGGLSKHIDIPNKYKKGKLVKNGKINGISTYNLVIGDGEDQMTIKDLVNVFENPNFGALTRTISLALRHGTPIQYLVEQLQKDKHSEMTSFSKVTARVLKSYIQDGTKSSDKTCPTCSKEDSLIYQDGCVMCDSCGWSKC